MDGNVAVPAEPDKFGSIYGQRNTVQLWIVGKYFLVKWEKDIKQNPDVI